MLAVDRGWMPLNNLVRIGIAIEDALIENPDGLELPYRLGFLKIIGYIPDRALVDYGATKKLGKTVFHTNPETDGYLFKVVWTPMHGSMRNGFSKSKMLLFKPGKRLGKKMLVKIRKDPYHFNRLQ